NKAKRGHLKQTFATDGYVRPFRSHSDRKIKRNSGPSTGNPMAELYHRAILHRIDVRDNKHIETIYTKSHIVACEFSSCRKSVSPDKRGNHFSTWSSLLFFIALCGHSRAASRGHLLSYVLFSTSKNPNGAAESGTSLSFRCPGDAAIPDPHRWPK